MKTPASESKSGLAGPQGERQNAGGGRRSTLAASASPAVGNMELQSLYTNGSVRTKLAVGAADDPAEAEADRMADAAMSDGPTACSCTQGQPPCAQCMRAAQETIRRKPRHHDLLAASPQLALGTGQPLSEGDQAFFSARYNADLSDVRIHDNPHAAAAATQLNASAFSVGSRIGFASGEYQPHSSAGKRLLGHELAHVARGHGGIRRQAAPGTPNGADAAAASPGAEVRLSELRPWIAIVSDKYDAAAVAQALYGSQMSLPERKPDWSTLYIGKLVGKQEFEIQPELLVEPHKARFHQLMEARLDADVAAVEAILLQTRIDDADENRLLDYVRWWSERKDMRTDKGRTYFDAFLARLQADTWHTDYLVTKSASKPFLDKLYTEVEEKVGSLNSLIAQNSREFGAYRPMWAQLEDLSKIAQGGAPAPGTNVDLATRTADLIAGRLKGVTTSEDSKVIGDLITGLPASMQAEVLRTLMNRFDEKDWTGIFGRFGEAWKGGMLYFLFEDLSAEDRTRVAASLKASKVLPDATVDALAGGRGWGGKYLPYTTRLGHEASEFYAHECSYGEGAASNASCAALGFSVLWTPETAGSTVATLATAGLGGPVAAASPTLGRIMLVGGTGLAAYQGTQALVELSTGKSMETGKALDSTDKLARGILLVSSTLFLAAGFMSAAAMSAKAPSSALTERPGAGIDVPAGGNAAGAGGATGEGAIPMRIVSMNSATGDCVVAGENAATGEVAIMRINMRTGDGVMQAGSRIRAVKGWQMQPERPLLGPAEDVPAASPAAPADQAALPGAGPKALPPRYFTPAEILPAPDGPFAVPALESAYQVYIAPRTAPATRSEWIRATRGASQELLVRLLGPNFPGAAPSAVEGDKIQLSRITRPGTLAQPALDQYLAEVRARPQVLAKKVGGMQRSGANGDEVDLGLFNNLKGNIGEILGLRIQTEVLASFPDAKMYSDLRLKLPGETPKEFSDNLIASEANGNLYIRAGFEIKSGGTGGQEATGQIHSAIEARLVDGAELILRNGRKFEYAPDKTGPGRVIFLASAPRHIIAPLGAQQFGTGSEMQVAAPVTRHALPVTPEELNYLARIIAEGMPVQSAPPVAGQP